MIIKEKACGNSKEEEITKKACGNSKEERKIKEDCMEEVGFKVSHEVRVRIDRNGRGKNLKTSWRKDN